MAIDGNARPVKLFAAAAVVFFVIAGGLALYVTQRGSGNIGTLSATDDAATADQGKCTAKAEKAKAVGKAATGEVAAMAAADPPQSLSALAFTDPSGKPTTLAAMSGKTILLNVWATWCAPCRAEMPELDALEKARGGPDFQVVAVNVDTGGEDKPRRFLAQTGATALGLYRDDTLGVFEDLKKRGLALGLPVSLLIDRDGCMIAHMNGPAAWASNDARRLIDAARG